MNTVPNQKVITVRKAKCDKKNVYATINMNAAKRAARDLTDAGRLLWMYLAMNQNGYTFALSNKALKSEWNMGVKQYNNAVKDLVEKGYLVCRQGNQWDFVESPVMPSEVNASGVNPSEDNRYALRGQPLSSQRTTVMPSEDKGLCPQRIRNIINTTIDNTVDNTVISQPSPTADKSRQVWEEDDYGFGELPTKRTCAADAWKSEKGGADYDEELIWQCLHPQKMSVTITAPTW